MLILGSYNLLSFPEGVTRHINTILKLTQLIIQMCLWSVRKATPTNPATSILQNPRPMMEARTNSDKEGLV